MLKVLDSNHYNLFKDDPVRPWITQEFRTSPGRENFVLLDAQNNPRAVLCCAYTNQVPTTEYELNVMSQAACQEGAQGSIAVFYTVWSYDRGAGRSIIFEAVDEILKYKPGVKRFVTLSPLTKMAERFHTRNGALLLQRGDECQNFEYDPTARSV